MFAKATTLRRCSFLACALALAQSADRDREAIQKAEATFVKSAAATRDQRLAWWRDAKFGCFIHWGVYSGPGGEWEGKPFSGYAEHLMRIKKIPLSVYKDKVVAPFNPTKFNADAWVSLIKSAGMRYLIITAKHHDGFAMWPSQVSKYNIHDATKFQRDPMKELSEACKRAGIKFGFYYSHAFDWEDPDAPGNDWDYDNPGGDRKLHGGDTWYDQHPELLEKARRYVDRKAIPQVRELIRMYHPDILWFDTPQKLPVSEQLRVVEAVRAADPNVIINGRAARSGAKQFGDYQNTGDRAAEFRVPEGDWETIPTTNESYGYHRFDNSHKPPEYFIRLLAKVAARGGNVLLNIGPMGTGEIDPKDQAILRGIGRWMNENGNSIYGTHRSPLAPQAWGETTLKGNVLYLHVLNWPANGKIQIGALPGDPVINVPPVAPDPVDSVLPYPIKGTLNPDPMRLLSATQRNILGVFDSQTMLSFTDGKAPHAYVQGWTKPDQTVLWLARTNQPAEFEVWAKYSTGTAAIHGKFAVEVAGQKLEVSIEPTAKDTEPREVKLGVIKVPAGIAPVRVVPVQIEGAELIRLWAVTLAPAAPPRP
jgi:alpha-L-fucosidase